MNPARSSAPNQRALRRGVPSTVHLLVLVGAGPPVAEQSLARCPRRPAGYRGQMTTLTGFIPPIATPFRDGALDLASLDRLIDDLAEHVSGYLVGGSVGEVASLTLEEREALMRRAASRRADAATRSRSRSRTTRSPTRGGCRRSPASSGPTC